jgi:hypothetical protein
MADITIGPQVKSLLAIVTLPARLRLPPVDHLGRFVLFFGPKSNGVTFSAVEAHCLHMSIMAESNFPHPLYRILDVSTPDSSQGNSGEEENSRQEQSNHEFPHSPPPSKLYFVFWL